jgi:phage recombination protein Bet
MSTVLKEESNQDDWREKKELIKRTLLKGGTDEELDLFAYVCKRTGLDPFMKQIFPVPRWDSKLGKNVYTFQTSIDGFRVIAERTGRYAPGPETTYVYNKDNDIVSATAHVKKLTLDGTWHTISTTAFWDEYCQKTQDGAPTKFWAKMGHVMLSKCAESLALRKAFPAELSGLYTMEEMTQAVKVSGNEEALTVDHAQMIELAKKPEEDLMDQMYQEFKDIKGSDKIPEYLEICFQATPKRTFLEGALNDPDRFLEFFAKWLDKNYGKKPVARKQPDLLNNEM